MLQKFLASPYLIRIVPFAAFAALTVFQGDFGEGGQYWIYTIKTLLGAALIWLVWPRVREMRWKFSPAAIAVGVVVFLIWVGLDGLYPRLGALLNPVLSAIGLGGQPGAPAVAFNPVATYGAGSVLAITFIAVRIIGSTLVVPPLEEVFYRSFLYRYLVKESFLEVDAKTFRWGAFLLVGLVFGVSHHEWLAGILCAFAYQGLVCYTGRLGDAMTAHAVTNFLLGIWVVTRPAWQFW